MDCIISDISPIAFEIADQLEVPSIGISNFTWYTAYKNIVPIVRFKYLKICIKNGLFLYVSWN